MFLSTLIFHASKFCAFPLAHLLINYSFVSYKELTGDERLDTGATEDEPPQKRRALSPFQSLNTPTNFTLEATLGSTATENQILLQKKPHNIPNTRKLYIPVSHGTKQTHVKTVTQPIILKHISKEKSLPVMRLTQQGHKSESLVGIQTITGMRGSLPIKQSNLIFKYSKRAITPSNTIVQDNRTPITPRNIIVQGAPSNSVVQDNRISIIPSNIIIQGDRMPSTPSNIIVQTNRIPTTSRNIVAQKSVQSVVMETKSDGSRTAPLNPIVRIEKLDVHVLNKINKSDTQTHR